MKKILVLIALLSLSGCAFTTVVPVDSDGNPEIKTETKTVINPEVEDKVDIALDVWCRNLKNARRIALRLIHVLDPEWQSVCEARNGE